MIKTRSLQYSSVDTERWESSSVRSVHHPGFERGELPFILWPAATYRNNEDKLRREERPPGMRRMERERKEKRDVKHAFPKQQARVHSPAVDWRELKLRVSLGQNWDQRFWSDSRATTPISTAGKHLYGALQVRKAKTELVQLCAQMLQ